MPGLDAADDRSLVRAATPLSLTRSSRAAAERVRQGREGMAERGEGKGERRRDVTCVTRGGRTTESDGEGELQRRWVAIRVAALEEDRQGVGEGRGELA